MPRTLNPQAHAVRRDAFIEVAQRLIQEKGYEQMSIQDVLDELDASRGAFYHYFDSKAALLDGVIRGMVDAAVAALEPVVDDPDRTAIDKFNGLFAEIASWKAERRELLWEVMRVWLSDDNAIVREKFRPSVVTGLTPALTTIIRQGVAEGCFTVAAADRVARVIVALVLGANEHAAELFVARQAGLLPFESVEGALAAYPEAIERILGARPGSLRWYDRTALLQWFG